MRKLLFLLTMAVSLLANQAEAKKMALLVGVTYDATTGWTDVKSLKDVDMLEEALDNAGFKVYTLKGRDATHEGILNAIKNLKCDPGDMVWIHFSGHGQQMADAMGDENDGLTEAFVPSDAPKRASNRYKGEKHLTDDEIKDALIPIRNRLTRTGQLLVTIDACHSGDGTRGSNGVDTLMERGTSLVFKPGKRIISKNRLAKNAASGIEISACQSSQSNYLYNNECGSLSHLLYLGIKKQGRKLSFKKLAEFVTDKANYKPIMPYQTPHRQQIK